MDERDLAYWREHGRQHMHDGPLLIEEQQVLEPGEVANVRLHPLFPGYWPDIFPGISLGMFEGPHQVGEAVVIEVVGPER